MKKYVVPLGCLLVVAAAHAADYSVAVGNQFQQFSRTPDGFGPGITLDYLHNDHNGSAGGAGLEMGFELGPVTLAAGGKVMALDPDSGSGTAGLVGGRVNFELRPGLSLFANVYQAPSSMASGSINKVSDRLIGVSWQPLRPLVLSVGYRYFNIDRQDSSRSRTLADGGYIGAGLKF